MNSLVFFFLILLLGLRPALPAMAKEKKTCIKEICLEIKEAGSSVTITAVNQAQDPGTISVDVTGQDLVDNQCPCHLSLKAGENKVVAKFSGSGSHWKYRYSWRWRWGLANQKHDDTFIYTLPFNVSAPVSIMQGYQGGYSHTEFGGYAIDFDLPVGSQVLAARKGKIVATQDTEDRNWTERDRKEHGNYIVILHEDGTLAEYIHLKKDGVATRVGQNVEAGDLIGYSGNTGFSTKPHLHFEVYTRVTAFSKIRFATRFKTKSGFISNFNTGDVVTKP